LTDSALVGGGEGKEDRGALNWARRLEKLRLALPGRDFIGADDPAEMMVRKDSFNRRGRVAHGGSGTPAYATVVEVGCRGMRHGLGIGVGNFRLSGCGPITPVTKADRKQPPRGYPQ